MTVMTVSLRKVATAAVMAASLVAGEIAVSTSASAGEWRHRGTYGRDAGPRHVAPHYGYGNNHHKPRRDRTGDAVGAAIVGIGALIVGAAIADAARNGRHRNYDRDSDND